MATDASFAEAVPDLAGLGDRLACRKMFGEYGYHLDGVFIALACDNSLFIKQTPAIDSLGLEFTTRPPYPGVRVSATTAACPARRRRALRQR